MQSPSPHFLPRLLPLVIIAYVFLSRVQMTLWTLMCGHWRKSVCAKPWRPVWRKQVFKTVGCFFALYRIESCTFHWTHSPPAQTKCLCFQRPQGSPYQASTTTAALARRRTCAPLVAQHFSPPRTVRRCLHFKLDNLRNSCHLLFFCVCVSVHLWNLSSNRPRRSRKVTNHGSTWEKNT